MDEKEGSFLEELPPGDGEPCQVTDQEPRPQEHRSSFVQMKAATGAAVLHAPQTHMDIFKWPQLLSVLFFFPRKGLASNLPFSAVLSVY